MTRSPHRRVGRLASRLLVGQTIVLLAAVLTAGLVASLAGPSIFHRHLLETGHQEDSPELTHIELAYRDASAISLGVAIVASLGCAIVVTWVMARRLNRSMTALTSAAEELTRGHYGYRVPDVASGTELDTLAAAFNDMAARLDDVETTRRRLLSDLAHELRTPISTLTIYHDGLHDGVTVLGPDSRTVLAEQTSRLARLADDIDEVSTAEEGRLALNLRTHAVSDLIAAACDAMRDAYGEKAVDLVTDTTGASGLAVIVDRDRIGQVLTNLLTNALRHTPTGGTVTVSAHRIKDEIALVVSDDGDGIPADQLPHVFERFYRGDAARTRRQSGSGIGLTITKAIVDAHGGSVEARSPGPGQGATFTVLLPSGGPGRSPVSTRS